MFELFHPEVPVSANQIEDDGKLMQRTASDVEIASEFLETFSTRTFSNVKRNAVCRSSPLIGKRITFLVREFLDEWTRRDREIHAQLPRSQLAIVAHPKNVSNAWQTPVSLLRTDAHSDAFS